MTIRTLAFLIPLVASTAQAYAPPQVSYPIVASSPSGFYVSYGVGQPYDCQVSSFTGADCQYHQFGHNLQLDASGAMLGQVVIPDDALNAQGDALDVLDAGPNGWLLRGSFDAVYVDANGEFTQASASLADDCDYTTWAPAIDGWWHVEMTDDYLNWQLVHTGFDGSELDSQIVAPNTENTPVVGVGTTGALLAVWSDDSGFFGQLYDASGNVTGGTLALGGADEAWDESATITATTLGFLVHTVFGSSDALVGVGLDGTVTQQSLPDRSVDDFGSRILTNGPHGGLLFDVSLASTDDDASGPLTVMQVDEHGVALESPRTVLSVNGASVHIASSTAGVVIADTSGTDVRISQLAADGSYITQAVMTNPGPGCSLAGHGNASPLALLLIALCVTAARARART